MDQYIDQEMTETHYELSDDEVSPLLKSLMNDSKLTSVELSDDDDGDNDGDNNNNNNNDNDSGGFDCNICLDSLEDPVVTFCGHVYCWPCIYKWLHHQQHSQPQPQPQQSKCPVCKAKITEKTLIPLYGRGQSGTKRPENTPPSSGMDIPRRPQRPEPSHEYQNQNRYYPHHAGAAYMGSRGFGPVGAAALDLDLSHLQMNNGVLGELVYARMFAYPGSYSLAGAATGSRGTRRRMMVVDRSLNRISFFLLCCVVLCLLLF